MKGNRMCKDFNMTYDAERQMLLIEVGTTEKKE